MLVIRAPLLKVNSFLVRSPVKSLQEIAQVLLLD